jgi:hypothetical protein
MIKAKAAVWTIMVAAVLLMQHPSWTQTNVRQSVLGNGGTPMSDASHRIIGTAGQPAIGVIRNTSFINQAGYWYQVGDYVTYVEQISGVVPKKFRLDQNFPNPFNPTTTIVFAIPEPSSVMLKLYDTLGREVAVLVEEDKQAGEYHVMLDAVGLASGIYFYSIEAGAFRQLRKMTLLK